jgi:integrase
MTVNRVPLTEAMIEEACRNPPERGTTRYLRDSVVPGFAVRVMPTGFANYYLIRRGKPEVMEYRGSPIPTTLDGQEVMTRDGPVYFGKMQGLARLWPGWLDRAREHAKPLLGVRAQPNKSDALEEQTGNIRSNSLERAFADFTRRYLESRAQPAHVLHCQMRWRKYIRPAWRGRDLRSITRKDVVALADSVADRGRPTMANKVLSLLSTFFMWCVDRELCETNPALRVRKPGVEKIRDRDLSDSELSVVWHAAGALHSPWGPWFRLLVLTGQRRREVADLRFSDIDFNAREWLLRRNKSNRPHIVPLSTEALEVLAGMPRDSDYVFTTTGAGPIGHFDYAKRLIDAWLAGRVEQVGEWNVHDLRRTVATGLGKLKVQPHVIGAVLNHQPQGITARVYNRYSYLDEKREALERWGAYVSEVAAKHRPAETERERADRERQAELQAALAHYKPTMTEAEADAALVATLREMGDEEGGLGV